MVPDYERNKKRILDKINHLDASFLTTSPCISKFFCQKKLIIFIYQIQAMTHLKHLNNYLKSCNVDVFFALSHGVHRGVLKSGKIDDRINFLKNKSHLHHT